MDGSLASQRLQGRHITPISTYFATHSLPQWVYDMSTYDPNRGTPRVTVSIAADSLGHRIVFLSRGTGTGPLSQLWLLFSDYQLVQQMLATLPIPLFPNESQASIMKRIKGALSVQFAGRGTFDDQR